MMKILIETCRLSCHSSAGEKYIAIFTTLLQRWK